MGQEDYIRWFETLAVDDVQLVGGKNASLGEMIQTLKTAGIQVPDGFATTARAYWSYVEANDLKQHVSDLIDDFHADRRPLEEIGQAIRESFLNGTFPEEVAEQIRTAYRELGSRYDREDLDVAVRSSATAEDLPSASFAGQQESFLNIEGEEQLLDICRRCYASLFTDRAISYREAQGFNHLEIALSIGVQKMIRSDKAGSGVMFTVDTETGFPDVALINAAWGLGENVVQGTVNPDQYTVFTPFLDNSDLNPIISKSCGAKEKKMIYSDAGEKPTENVDTSDEERNAFVLSDEEILQLARWADAIEEHYEREMDIEWAKDGDDGHLYILQARPETVQSRREAHALKTFTLKEEGRRLVSGLSIGDAITSGAVCAIEDVSGIDQVREGCILVTEQTDPDWVPIMKKAAGIVTDHGGRTSHAAIVSRELGIPAVVGTGNATELLQDGQEVTLSCAEGDEGHIYEGLLEYDEEEIDLSHIESTDTRIMINIASPAGAMRWWRLPVQGVGLARMEYIINNIIKIHPMALVEFDELEDEEARREIEQLTVRYEDKSSYFVDHLAWGIGTIAASRHPDPVIVRMSDFKTNEYADLIGGRQYEPVEANPMLGWRGASRYYSEDYREGFALECRAIKKVREDMGFTNVVVMIPFCRTPEEADRVLEVMAEYGLERGRHDLQVYVMCEVPSNVIVAEDFAERFDGFSIGSNDLTQLVLGIDRDSVKLSYLFDERHKAVQSTIRDVIERAHAKGRPVGICGQAPSDYPEFARFLVEAGIDSISLNPDSVPSTIHTIAEVEHAQEQTA